MYKTKAEIGDRVFILKGNWEKFLISDHKFSPIIGNVVKKYESDNISYHGSYETEIITVAEDAEHNSYYDKQSWIDNPYEFYTIEELSSELSNMVKSIDNEIIDLKNQKEEIFNYINQIRIFLLRN